MTKAERGLKRLCQGCGARFYDLLRDPILCPKCGATFNPLAFLKPRRSRAAAKAPPPPPPPPEPAPSTAAPADEAKAVDETEDIGKDKSDENDDVIEDASELGGDGDDVSEVMEGAENPSTEEER